MTFRTRSTPRLHIVLVLAAGIAAPRAGESRPVSESWSFRVYESAGSAATHESRDFAEDLDGTMWVATWGQGVVAISSQRVRSFRKTDGLPGDWTTSVAVDQHGHVWVATADGLARIHRGQVMKFTRQTTPELEDDEFALVRSFSNGEIWASGDSGRIYEIDCRESGEAGFSVVASPELTGGAAVTDAIETDGGTTRWVAARSGALRHEGDLGWTTEQPQDVGRPERIALASDGSIWVVGSRGVSVRRNGVWGPAPEGLLYQASTVARTPGGRTWIGGRDGIFEWNGHSWEIVYFPGVAGPNLFMRIHFSRDRRTVWIAHRGGVIRGRLLSWRRSTLSENGARLRPTSFCERPSGAPLCVDEVGALTEYRDGRWRELMRLPVSPRDDLWLGVRREDRLVVLDRGEIFEVSLPSGRIGPRTALPDHVRLPGETKLSRLFLTESGEVWVLGEKDAFVVDGARFDSARPAGSPREDRLLQAIAEDADGSIWVAYNRGLERWTDSGVEDLSERHPELRDVDIEAVCRARDGSVWLGTDGEGIIVLRGSELDRITTADGLAHDLVSAIHHASTGEMWIAYRQLGFGALRDGYWFNSDYRHGVPIRKVLALGEFPRGTTWIACLTSGLLRHEPDLEGPRTSIGAAPDVISASGVGVFSFHGRDAWDKTRPEDLAYSWRITSPESGAERRWSMPSKATSVSAPRDLPWGDHVFEVRSIDLDGNVDAEPAEVRFRVEAPLWSRAEFVLPLVLLGAICVAIGLALLQKHVSLRRSQQRLSLLNSDLERRLDLEALLASASEHLLALPAARGELGVADMLQTLTAYFSADRFDFVEYDQEHASRITRRWSIDAARLEDVVDEGSDDASEDWLLERFERGNTVFARRSEVGARRFFDSRGTRAGVFVRFSAAGRPLGHFSLEWSKQAPSWQLVLFDRLRAVGDLIAGAIIRRKADAERRELELQLQQAQKLDAIGTLAAGVSHDFNNVLTAIQGFADFATPLVDDDDARESIVGILDATAQARAITRSLLTFSRISTADKAPLRLRDTAEGALGMLRHVLPANVVLKTDLARREDIWVDVDAVQIQHAVVNLALNARDAMPDGGRLEIRIGTRTKSVAESIRRRSPRVGRVATLTIADTGQGIPEALVDRIFEPFFSTKARGQGTGLGLAIVHGIVADHGGAVSVNSRPGVGSTFTIELPLCPAPARAAAVEPSSPSSVAPPGETVLLVEDNLQARAVLSTALRQAGYEILVAATPGESIQFLGSYPGRVDAVVLDADVPGTDGGVAFLRQLRRQRGDLLAVLITGRSDESLAGLENGKTRLLRKPMIIKDLRRAVAEMVRERAKSAV